MTNVVGVKFKESGKVYYFDPIGLGVKLGDHVIVETSRGVECGEVAMSVKSLPDDQIVKPLRPLLRSATEEDKKRLAENRRREKDAFAVCNEKIAAHGLDMKLVDVEYTFDNNKVLFYFTSDGRVDFRELVKDLASVFRTRIELRQIGVRDEAKMLGGFGICGQPFCCARFLGDFQPVSIKMAKEQGLSLNPAKISGICGRLMCCLKYEQDAYEYLLKITPKVGASVKSKDGYGTVIENNLISGTVKVRSSASPEAAPLTYRRHQLEFERDKDAPPIPIPEEKEETTPADAAPDYSSLWGSAPGREEKPVHQKHHKKNQPERKDKNRPDKNRKAESSRPEKPTGAAQKNSQERRPKPHQEKGPKSDLKTNLKEKAKYTKQLSRDKKISSAKAQGDNRTSAFKGGEKAAKKPFHHSRRRKNPDSPKDLPTEK